MNRKICLAILFAALLATWTAPFRLLADEVEDIITGREGNVESEESQAAEDEDGYQSIAKLMFVIQKIRSDYVDPDKTGYEELVTGAMKGMARGLDPFSAYMDKKDFAAMIDDAEGREFGGIGLSVNYRNSSLIVIAPIEGSPAFRAGIKPGDEITEIEGVKTSTISFDECVKMMRGEPGTEVKITVFRESENSTFPLTLKRELIGMSTVTGAKVVEDGIAYLRISQFNVPTSGDLDKALNKLREEGMRALVMDLRGNPGGLLSSAIDVASRFVDTGELIVYTEGRLKTSRFDHYSVKCEKFLDLPMVLLVDGNSASASEIVAGCLQDHKKAVLVGEKTYGKGSVQTIFPLPDNSGAIRLTIAKYYTPSSRVIHGNGIDPTVQIPVSTNDMFEIYRQRQSYPGVVKPAVKNAIADVQLQRAIEILKGICVFGDTIYSK